jgi:nitrite reductase (NO-forming)/hydroxylamine reductase
MKTPRLSWLPRSVLLAALPFSVMQAWADTAATSTSAPEAKYQGAASPLASEPMHQNINPKAPPMTEAEFGLAKQIYFERCAGCHGCCARGPPASR